MKYILLYLLIINAFTFIIMAIDKRRAVKSKWRISESTLFLLTLIGGSLSILVSMKLFHHKSSKNSFKIVIYFIIVLQLLCILYVMRKFIE